MAEWKGSKEERTERTRSTTGRTILEQTKERRRLERKQIRLEYLNWKETQGLRRCKAKEERTEREKREEHEQILKEVEDSDSNDNVNVSVTDCLKKSETAYEEYIQCTNCFRRFHSLVFLTRLLIAQMNCHLNANTAKRSSSSKAQEKWMYMKWFRLCRAFLQENYTHVVYTNVFSVCL